MKIAVIHGQDHKGSTYHIAHSLAEKIGGEITEFFLPRDFGEFCCGCDQCFEKGAKYCPHYEKLKPITRAVDAADVLILASPVYVYHSTGAMKAWLDHYGWMWIVHRPRESMFSKKAVVVTTAAGAGMASAAKDMKDSLSFWGVPQIYSLGAAVMSTSWENVSPAIKKSINKRTDKIALKIRYSSDTPKASIKGKILFTAMHFANIIGWNPADRKYWQDKGWTGKERPWKSKKQGKSAP